MSAANQGTKSDSFLGFCSTMIRFEMRQEQFSGMVALKKVALSFPFPKW